MRISLVSRTTAAAFPTLRQCTHRPFTSAGHEAVNRGRTKQQTACRSATCRTIWRGRRNGVPRLETGIAVATLIVVCRHLSTPLVDGFEKGAPGRKACPASLDLWFIPNEVVERLSLSSKLQ